MDFKMVIFGDIQDFLDDVGFFNLNKIKNKLVSFFIVFVIIILVEGKRVMIGCLLYMMILINSNWIVWKKGIFRRRMNW